MPIFKAHPESPIKPRSFQFYNQELGQINGFIPFLLFNTICIGFELTPILALMVNIVTEYGLTRTETGYLFMTLAITEVIFRLVWGKLGQYFKTSAMIVSWSAVRVFFWKIVFEPEIIDKPGILVFPVFLEFLNFKTIVFNCFFTAIIFFYR